MVVEKGMKGIKKGSGIRFIISDSFAKIFSIYFQNILYSKTFRISKNS